MDGRSRLGGIATVALILAALVALVAQGNGDVRSQTTPPAGPFDSAAPNVIVVMTDDQALDTMWAMPRTRRLIGDAGTTYENFFVSFPLCCPSRATFLTGQYAHNHGVRNNHPPNGGYQALDSERTLPVWLTRAGYRTGLVGKYLNGYGEEGAETEVPPGWSEWYGLPAKAKQRAYDFDLNENGEIVHYGEPGEAGPYKTEVLEARATSFVERAAAGRRPFFLWVATNGPHRDSSLPDDAERNPEPAARDRGAFDGRRAPRHASMAEADVTDKPREVRELPQLSAARKQRLDREYVSQLESLQSIDRLVARLVRRVRAAGELERTVFVFTSDNGYLRGQHRLEGKSRPYEEAIRVPLMIRGPGFAAGARDQRLTANIDLAPTVLALSGARADLTVDGTSLFDDGAARRDAVLLEVFDRDQAFQGLRTERWAYAEYESGDRELYDLRADPQQLQNLADDRRSREVVESLAGQLERLRTCRGPARCR